MPNATGTEMPMEISDLPGESDDDCCIKNKNEFYFSFAEVRFRLQRQSSSEGRCFPMEEPQDRNAWELMWGAQRPQEGGGSGRPRASPRYLGVGPHFAGRCPGWPGPRATRARAVARGAPGGGAVAAVALSRGRAISAAAMSRGRAISAAVVMSRGGASPRPCGNMG